MLLERKARWRQRRQISKANGDWFFIYALAKELGMTVAQLCQTMTQEELVGWAAFFELKNEEEEKAMQNAKVSSRAQTMRRR